MGLVFDLFIIYVGMISHDQSQDPSRVCLKGRVHLDWFQFFLIFYMIKIPSSTTIFVLSYPDLEFCSFVPLNRRRLLGTRTTLATGWRPQWNAMKHKE